MDGWVSGKPLMEKVISGLSLQDGLRCAEREVLWVRVFNAYSDCRAGGWIRLRSIVRAY